VQNNIIDAAKIIGLRWIFKKSFPDIII